MTIGNDVGILSVVPVHGPMSTHATTGTLVIPQGTAQRFCCSEDGRVPSRALVKAVTWDPAKHCKPAPKRQATHHGDPHLLTFDGTPRDARLLCVALSRAVRVVELIGDAEPPPELRLPLLGRESGAWCARCAPKPTVRMCMGANRARGARVARPSRR